MQIRKIVVGTDFSAGAQSALEAAIDIAHHAGAEIVLAHATMVTSRDEDAPFDESPSEWVHALDGLASERREKLAALHEQYADRGVPMSEELTDAVPAKGVIDIAEQVGADLIVVGTHGRSGLMRFLLGSVAMRVIRRSKVSVLAARPRREGSDSYRRKILVPTDFSPSSEVAIELAADLVEPGGSIELAHFWQLPAEAAGSWAYSDKTLGKHVQSLHQLFADAAEKRGHELTDTHQREGIDLHFSHTRTHPKAGIQGKLETEPFDLVVMGSSGRRGLKRWLLGSVAESAVRHAPCSVLVARSGDDNSEA